MLQRQSKPVNGLNWGTAGAAGNFATKKAFFDAETGAEGNFATKKAFFGAEIASEYNLATKTWCFVAKFIFISGIL